MMKRVYRRALTKKTAAAAMMIAAVCTLFGCGDSQRAPLIPGTNRPLEDPSEVMSKEGIKRADERSVQVVVIPVGRVPWDSASLPLVSPNGRYIATHTGVAAPLSTVLASEGAEPPAATYVERFRITPGQNTADPEALGRLDQAVLLGRSVDRDGFLVESPRPDGARWIGKASWTSGAIDWLVDDEHVNAHASLGRDNRVAYSRLNRETGSWQLIVRDATGDEWIFGAAGEDWLMPMWSGRDDGLFALRMRAGELRLVFGIGFSRAAFRQSFREFPLVAGGMTRKTAFKMVENLVNIADGPRPDTSALTFVHPTEGAMAMWRPLDSEHDRVLLNPQSFAAAPVDRHYALVSLRDRLVRRHVSDVDDEMTITRSLSLVRPVDDPDWPLDRDNAAEAGMTEISAPFLMMTPGPDGVQLTALYLVKS